MAAYRELLDGHSCHLKALQRQAAAVIYEPRLPGLTHHCLQNRRQHEDYLLQYMVIVKKSFKLALQPVDHLLLHNKCTVVCLR